ncbi:hypothetical protein CXG81DRAFT_10827 [Caulochytrium protostelioides]|uniref:tRNA:m(4)X modification enzyme TRM13 n=1 Tax=Caulochytrium protostelioides TaxID=1555241 RepID=A0A4P9XAM7_9FUNG|nr:DUF715-domain-containing protein [Caulochytrium protostelioides]RKP02385.1 hypothetical protein CXG81DRAFT_10827 [Caulochytrium protostelioides]|eukprot:RKP02385.1 hypothetical protein CXG81DRAFT_10827 [Caulochytrium protostelioides]
MPTVAPTTAPNAPGTERKRKRFPKCAQQRILCPLDPKHTVAVADLDRHMAKCNARQRPRPSWHASCVNDASEPCDVPLADPLIRSWLPSLPLAVFKQHVAQIEAAFSRHVEHPTALEHELRAPVEEQCHSSLKTSGGRAPENKHLRQQGALLHWMEKLDWIGGASEGPPFSRVFVDFGAGKGDLTERVQHAIAYHTGASRSTAPADVRYLLVDRQHFRHKRDVAADESHPELQRLTMDIQDLNLAAAPFIQAVPETAAALNVMAISKHLCGAATDLTLRCLIKFEAAVSESSPSKRCSGIVVALCCHHVCNPSTYVGMEYLQSLGIALPAPDAPVPDLDVFNTLVSLTSWATCGRVLPFSARKHAEEHSGASADPNHRNDPATEPEASKAALEDEHWSGLPFEERELLGLKAKQLLNAGRVHYLKKAGWSSVKLVSYVDRSTTLENRALIAHP